MKKLDQAIEAQAEKDRLADGPGYRGMSQLEAEALVRKRFGLDVDVSYSRSCPRGGRAPIFGVAFTRKASTPPGFECLGAGRSGDGLAAFREAWRAAEARLGAATPAAPPPAAPPAEVR